MALPKIMRAVRVHEFGGPECLKLDNDVPLPSYGPNQVLIKLHATGINPVDTYIRSGTFPMKPNLPYIPGGDGAGIVAAIGDQVQNMKVGDRVFAVFSQGMYAEYAVADYMNVFHLPNNVSFAGGAALGVPYFTAYRAIFDKCHAKRDESIFIHGASGGVGLAAVQLSKAYGLIIYATAGTEEGLAVVKENGADFVFNHTEKDYIKKVMLSTNNKGVNIIIEMLSNINLQSDLELIADFGRIAVVGCRGNIEISPRVIMAKESCVVGVMLGKTTQFEMRNMGDTISKGLRDQTL